MSDVFIFKSSTDPGAPEAPAGMAEVLFASRRSVRGRIAAAKASPEDADVSAPDRALAQES